MTKLTYDSEFIYQSKNSYKVGNKTMDRNMVSIKTNM